VRGRPGPSGGIAAQKLVEQDRDKVALLEERRLDGLFGKVGRYSLADETCKLATRHGPTHGWIDPLADGGREDAARFLDLRLAVRRALRRGVDCSHDVRRLGRGTCPAATRGEIGYRSGG
jgi:hypothetical protein